MCNKNYLQMTKLKSLDEIRGKSDMDLPWGTAAETINVSDLQALDDKEVTVIELIPLEEYHNHFITLISQKKPFKDQQNKISGVAVSAMEVTSKEINSIIFHLNKTLALYKSETELLTNGRNYYLHNNYCDSNLTKREAECFFYFLQGRTAKEIANILFISKRTVEKHIVNIKDKFNVKKKSDLIDIAVAKNLLTIIPPSLLHRSKCFSKKIL